MNRPVIPIFAARSSQRGFTLIELMIAMALAVFLVGGVMSLLAGTRRTFNSQNQMAQLQDSERMAMTLIGDVIQTSGYYPDPTTTTINNAFPAVGVFATTQAVSGTASAAAPGDTITTRYVSGLADDTINCIGTSNTGPGQSNVSKFSIVPTGAPGSSGTLVCQLNGNAAVPLVSGVTNLKVYYGVDTNGDGSADQYLRGDEVTAAAQWGTVISVRVTLTFVNPLFPAAPLPANGQPPTIDFTRVIDVMAKTGVSTT